MSDAPFVDKDGNELEDYDAYKEYYKNNKIETICDMVESPEGDIICLTTRQNGLVYAFKVVAECAENNDCKYDGFIKDCNTEEGAAELHAEIKSMIENGEDLE